METVCSGGPSCATNGSGYRPDLVGEEKNLKEKSDKKLLKSHFGMLITKRMSVRVDDLGATKSVILSLFLYTILDALESSPVLLAPCAHYAPAFFFHTIPTPSTCRYLEVLN